jgi:hypothetical protein
VQLQQQKQDQNDKEQKEKEQKEKEDKDKQALADSQHLVQTQARALERANDESRYLLLQLLLRQGNGEGKDTAGGGDSDAEGRKLLAAFAKDVLARRADDEKGSAVGAGVGGGGVSAAGAARPADRDRDRGKDRMKR